MKGASSAGPHRRILITDGEQRAALALTRSLGAKGHSVIVGSVQPRPLAGASRFCRGTLQLPDPLAGPGDFIDAVQHAVQRLDIDVLVPVTEAALLAVLPRRETLNRVQVPFPPIDAFRRASDKALVTTAAADLGIRVPAQRVLTDPRTIREDLGTIRYPIVLKPHRSVVNDGDRQRKLGVGHANAAAEAERFLAACPAAAYPVLVQERIEGPGTGVFLLMWDDQVQAQFAHRRLREKPPTGGVSVYRESIAAPADLVDRSAELLRILGCQGVAMVEYKVDRATGVPYLMEINCRFWGSLQLAIDAGVDFPALLLDCAAGVPPDAVPDYRVGVRCRWLWGDVDHLWARLNRGGSRNLPADAPGRLQTLLMVAMPWRPGDRTEVFRLSDPMPFLRESSQWFSQLRR